MDISREQLRADLEAYESEVKAQAVRDAAAGSQFAKEIFAVASVGAIIAGGRAALVGSRLERERKQLEEEGVASVGRREFLASALAGSALGAVLGRASGVKTSQSATTEL